uniref:Uncharacterized protein n=1 Tax=Heterorhabditis bacteriophora TaxID=37862 RepID=A0A1I7WC06_HETBA
MLPVSYDVSNEFKIVLFYFLPKKNNAIPFQVKTRNIHSLSDKFHCINFFILR